LKVDRTAPHDATKQKEKTGHDKGAFAVAFALLSAALLASGCAVFSPDGGMLAVEAAAQTELGKDVIKIRSERDDAVVAERVKALLAKPLTASAAVQIALLNNRAVQAAYNELGISEAEMVEASLPPAPTFTLLRIVGSGFEIERHIIENVLALITLPRRREIAEAQFRQAQVRAIEATLRVAADAARAYYRAVAANEAVKTLEESRLSAEAVSDLAMQLGETGAMSKLDQAREHVFYAEVSGQLATARLRQRMERERLIRALGLWGADTRFALASALPALPDKPKSLASIEGEAVSRRADLVIARIELDILALRLGLTRKTRLINALEVAGVSKVDKDIITKPESVEIDKFDRGGFQVDLQIPIYDFGEARVRRAEETYMRAANRLLELAVSVRSEAREAYQLYRDTYDIARHYEREVLPLRKIIADETLLNYNAMIRDPIALLSDARARLLSNVQAIEARRDFWLATVDLNAAIIGGRGVRETTEPAQTVSAASSGSTAD
jgi:outer membrane protein TolC